MKKQYQSPFVEWQLVELSSLLNDASVITSVSGEDLNYDGGSDEPAHGRRNDVWETEEEEL